MRNILFLFVVFVVFSLNAQKTISGSFSPAKDYSWLIAYQLKPGNQVYVADTAIKNGQFTLQIPENAQKGTYRLVYAVPQDEFYFDVFYNGTEDINLNFNSRQGVEFTASKENILYGTYFDETSEAEQQLIDFYASGKANKPEFLKLTKKLENLQNSYEKKSEGLLVHHFIKANHPYVPVTYETVQEYIQNKKKKYFDKLDFNDSVLQGTEFLTSKLVNYVFTALPTEQSSESEISTAIRENIETAATRIQEVNEAYQFSLFYSLWKHASTSELNDTADFIYHECLKTMASSKENKELIDQIEITNRLRIGAKAPEIEWTSRGKPKKLSTLKSAKNYLLIFWSSTCSHCLRELPMLHKELMKRKGILTLAIGLEDDELTWRLESEKLESFEHAIALGKWESNYAKIYDIHRTPSYFILNENKEIIAKPENDIDVIEFFK